MDIGKIVPLSSGAGVIDVAYRTPLDLSQRAIRFARIIDRLEAGTYTITVQKDTDGRMLRVTAARNEVSQVWEL